ncbi:MAG: hypothetical protein KGL75_02455, partial [Acidobacteriota bacterium]|nr:hypothetical protein [Acidobacteriota bacterium]
MAAVVALAGFTARPANAHVSVAIGVGVGPAVVYAGPPPVCPYGYYPYAPYACAPYGYYGPEWFDDDVFIGAGPWFCGFYGQAFYGDGFDFDDPGWVYFHDRDGWRYFHDGDRWRDFRGYGERGYRDRDGRWQDFRYGDHRDFRGGDGWRSFR